MLNFFCWKNHFSAERTTFWAMLNFSPERSMFFQKCASFCWNVEYVRSCWMPFLKKVLLSAEMLNMLNMLNYFGSIWSFLAFHRPKIIQHIQHIQHFSRKKHIFSKIGSNMIQHIQHFSRKKHIWYTCWIIFPEITTFWAMLNFFCWKNHIFEDKGFFLLKCWICWIILPLVVPLAFHRPKIIQHIQHIQHFSRKKHIFGTFDPTWFNIFNISAERRTFPVYYFLRHKKCPELQK